MGDDGGLGIFLGFFGICFLCLLISFFSGREVGMKKIRVEAVRNGYGLYEVDDRGNTTFAWKKQ